MQCRPASPNALSAVHLCICTSFADRLGQTPGSSRILGCAIQMDIWTCGRNRGIQADRRGACPSGASDCIRHFCQCARTSYCTLGPDSLAAPCAAGGPTSGLTCCSIRYVRRDQLSLECLSRLWADALRLALTVASMMPVRVLGLRPGAAPSCKISLGRWCMVPSSPALIRGAPGYDGHICRVRHRPKPRYVVVADSVLHVARSKRSRVGKFRRAGRTSSWALLPWTTRAS